jgi:hypothetical protein
LSSAQEQEKAEQFRKIKREMDDDAGIGTSNAAKKRKTVGYVDLTGIADD